MRIPWNKGLTKETDIRVAQYSKKIEGRKFSKEVREKMSKARLGVKTGMTEKRFEHLSRIWKLPKTKKQIEHAMNNIFKLAKIPRTEKQIEVSKENCRKTGRLPKNKNQRERCRKLGSLQIGEKNFNWKGGITPLSSLIKSSSEYKKWSRSIFIRDGFTCKKCGKYNCKIECHHNKKPFRKILSEFLNYYNQFSPIEDKETLFRLALTWGDFWNIDNGETLCMCCHNETRKEYFKCQNTHS